jgi:hypothetical protein
MSTVDPTRDYMSTRLQCIARCLRACNAWVLRRDCRFHVALRMTRLCKVALGDLFSASTRESQGWSELKTVAAEWTRRLRIEIGVAMVNVDACQCIQENRKLCKDIVNFKPKRSASVLQAGLGRHTEVLITSSPLHSNQIRAETNFQAVAHVSPERNFQIEHVPLEARLDPACGLTSMVHQESIFVSTS